MNRDVLARAAGVGFIALAALAAYWAIYEPMELAKHGAAEVSYRMKGVLVVPMALVLGLAYVAGGEKADTLLRQPGGQRPTKWGIVLAVAGVGLGGLLYWWFENQLTAMGYVQI